VEAAGWGQVLVTSEDELPDAVADPSGIRVVEVPTGRTDLRAVHARIRAAVSAAVRG
jgi:2-succinyl-5-enolpyruvyl-6-hydroxy-3-cyclohexene-1-carboxylate synthase